MAGGQAPVLISHPMWSYYLYMGLLTAVLALWLFAAFKDSGR